jgi:hypothetical protein
LCHVSSIPTLYGEKFGGVEDLMDTCPRQVECDNVVSTIQNLINENKADAKSLQNALKPLQGKNYSHYVYPSPDVLANEAKKKLEERLPQLPRHVLLTIERTAI